MNNQKHYILLKQIINEVDPIGLIDPATPESLKEYEPELKEILKEDISQFDKEKLSQRIFNIFILFFNEEIAGSKDKYDLIANKFIANKS